MAKTTLTLMVGLPRSGKSTWIKENKTDEIVIEQDWIRTNVFGHQFHGPAEPFLFAVVSAMIRTLINQGKDVILDATCLTKDIRNRYIRIAEESNSNIKIVWLCTHIDTCCDRNESSPKGQQVPRDLLRAMNIRLEKPMKHEYNELVIVEEN